MKVKRPGEPPRYDAARDGDLTEWFKRYCARFELIPFDSTKDTVDPKELKESCDAALRDLAEAGLIWRYGPQGITPEIRARAERELKILADKLISAYFLIVWDFVNWARQRGIPANARGSGVGTMVGYVLGLSNACPERYGLLFERFTDPDRSEYPDIDIDICQDGRGAVIDYVRKKYGHVAQIITFGRLKAKAAIKDVARVMGLAPSDGQRLANLIPNELHITIAEAKQKEPELKRLHDEDATIRRLLDQAEALEDHARNQGVHAAGVIVATQPLGHGRAALPRRRRRKRGGHAMGRPDLREGRPPEDGLPRPAHALDDRAGQAADPLVASRGGHLALGRSDDAGRSRRVHSAPARPRAHPS